MSRKKKNLATGALLDSAEAVTKAHQLKIIEPVLLGERLRKTRIERKISQRDLTEGLFTSAYLSSVELGKTRPTLETLGVLAERLGKSVDFFLQPSGKNGSGENIFKEEFSSAKLRNLELKQRLVRAETALLENKLDLAEQELNDLENITGLTRADQVYYHLLEAALRNRQDRPGEALEILAQLTDSAETAPGLAAGSELAARLELESGRAYKIQNHYFTALEHLHKGLKTATETNPWRRDLLLETGDTYRLVDEPQKEAGFLQQGLDLFDQTNTIESAHSLYQKAQELAGQGDLQEAAFVLGMGYQLARQTGENAFRLDYTLKASQLNYTLKNYEQAANLARTAESLAFASAGHPGENNKARFSSLVLVAKSYVHNKETGPARFYLDQAAQFLEKEPAIEPLEKAAYFEVAALTCSESGPPQPEKAADFYEKAIALLEPFLQDDEKNRSKVKPQLAEIYYNYSQLLKDMGRVDQTLENLEKAYRLRSQ